MTDLLRVPLDELLAAAASMRDEHHGTRVTWSPKVFIPLTMLCRDKCGYCTFAQPPARLDAPYLSPEQVLAIASAGADAGCKEALFTLGERPELRYPVAQEWLRASGYETTVDYLAAMCELVITETGLLPHANAGALDADELRRALRVVSASQGMMVESLNADLDCHRGSPDKTPDRRLATLDAAGELRIPFTTGILVRIGESREDRVDALEAIAASHRRHGHVQEVIVQNFLPKPGTAMHNAPPCPPDEFLWSIAVARLVLPADVHLQAPPNLSEDFGRLLDAGIDDWGGVSPVTPDHVNPERPWPAVERLRAVTEAHGFELAPRLTIYPEYAQEPITWLDQRLRFPVLDVSDAEGLARDTSWSPGSDASPPVLLPGERAARGRVQEILDGVLLGQEVGEDEIVTLFGARGREVVAVAEVADQLRRETVGDVVTWVSNRNINYTNVCTFKCKFCAFSKGPMSENLRGKPYLLTLEDIQDKVVEAVGLGATEVCLQGGIHPSFDGDYYIDVAHAVKDVAPDIHIHGFTALEVTEGARRLGEPLADYLQRLMDAGLRTLPGTAAEILDDDVRAVLCPDKVNTEQWLEAHRTAHSLGLRSNVTIMFGSIEQPRSWARHMLVTRELQKETGGFTEFVPLPFVHMEAPIYHRRMARRGPTFREALLMHAVGRIAYHGSIDNIQASWVKMGLAGMRQSLQAGVNDLGGTLIDENISRAAGASHGQHMTGDDFAALVAGTGRRLEQRTTLYGRVVGRVSPAHRYNTGDPDIDRRIEELLDAVGAIEDRDQLFEILVSGEALAGDHTDRLDLKITNAALKEMRNAFNIFAPYRDVPKVTIFGSARTRRDDPLYVHTVELARGLATRGWMVVTGAGPGIMEAGMEGAGRERAIGVQIRLPFEERANEVIAGDPKLAEMKYFFTRKLMLVKESQAFVALPGGFGTLDETFELLTLVQTGKAMPVPIVLLDTPHGTYWRGFERFLHDEVAAMGLISVGDDCLFRITDSVDDALAEIERFYRNYHSLRFVGDRLVLRVHEAPTKDELDELSRRYADVLVDGRIESTRPYPPEVSSDDHVDLPRIQLHFNNRSFGELRRLIDDLNRLDSAPEAGAKPPTVGEEGVTERRRDAAGS